MATTTIKKETPANIGAYTKAETDAAISESAKISIVEYTPENALAAGDKGYFTIPVPSEVKNKTILATTLLPRHLAAAVGYQLTGGYISGDYLYVSYYTPIAIPAVNVNADIIARILYR